MRSPFLQLGNNIFSVDNLPATKNATSFDERVIDFCRQWQAGQETFELQTSGSTGAPKKIVVGRRSLEESAKGTIIALGLQRQQTALVCLDPAHIAGVMMLVRSLENEMNIVGVEPCANPFEKLQPNSTVDFAALVPYQVKSILASAEQRHFSRPMAVLIGGAPVENATVQLLQNYEASFFETFGMTETISHIALKPINGVRKSSFFTTLPTVSIRQDERACLCIRTTYIENEIFTNDIVELVSVNQFIWLGRWDNVINSGGLKIFPETIEIKLEPLFRSLHVSNNFFVAGQPDERWGQAVHLFIEGDLSKAKQDELTKKMEYNLFKFELPKGIHFLPSFVRTNSEKVSRTKTLSLFGTEKNRTNN